ncbi:MAG: TetR/AcrR family transcriptional regulator C-terminal domain-containing protein [Lachnospiraceae bacterium]|nr:TetR/AcrR family transcriptional regulator C-terminal domain-containing protein [Lachnospiraceae bacterium]
MNNKTDNTKSIDMLLAESFKKLVAKKTIEKITIREITDLAGVIRPTFYNHFQDKYELLEWIIVNEIFAPMDPLIDRGELSQAVEGALSVMQEEKEFYDRAVRLTGQNSFREIMTDHVAETILSRLPEVSGREKIYYQWLTPRRLAYFFAGQIVYVVMSWLEDGMKVPPRELVGSFMYFCNHSIIEMVEMVEAEGRL